jgi:cell division septum initiation protein DivIVA
VDNSEFQLVFRGYDKDEVDTAVAAMREELDHVRDYNYKAASEVEFLKSEIASLKQRLKRDAGTGYAELGAQFEQTLRVAEEQARKLMTDAGQDALRIRETAKAESEQLTRKAEAAAQKLLSDADSRAKEIRLDAERSSAEILAQAKTQESEASEKTVHAQREAAVIRSEGERYAAELRASVHRETEEARALATELAQRTAQSRVELEAEMRAKRDEGEQEALRIYESAVKQAQAATDEANKAVAEASRLAAGLNTEAERTLREAKITAANVTEDAQRNAGNLINQSRRRAELLARKAEAYANAVIVDGQERLARWESESNEIEDFLNTLKSLMSTESMVAADETLAQSELEGSSPSITDGFDTSGDSAEESSGEYEAIEVESYEDKRD